MPFKKTKQNKKQKFIIKIAYNSINFIDFKVNNHIIF
jgi:hypothetical protein